MSIQREVGDKLFLTLQLYNLDATRRVFVDLRKGDGTQVEPAFEISHVANGVYRENAKTMPNEPVINAFYYVYKPDGVTLDTGYTAAEDRFMLEATCTTSILVDSHNLMGTMDGDAELEATVDEADISGTMDGEVELTATMIDANILGEVLDEC